MPTDPSLFATIRGFNYQPGYAATGLEIWALRFAPEQIDRELERCKRYFPRTNLLRLWLSFDAWLHDSKAFAANVECVLGLVDKHGMRAMPCLFNNWHSLPDFGGVAAEMVGYWNHPSRCHAFTGYLDAVIGAHRDDPRVLLWDLCNEPFNGGGDPDVFLPWLRRLREHCDRLRPAAPITIGVPSSVPGLTLVEPLCDVLTPHCYFAEGLWSPNQAAFEENLDAVAAYIRSTGKPGFAGETGWGELDDARRVRLLRIELAGLTARGLGFCIHMLNHSLVGDGHRPEYGPVSEAGFMGCIEADGSLRAGHEVIREF